MLTVGVTGGLATGKSAVTHLLQECGATVFSADEAARAVMTPGGPTLRAIIETFGPEMQNAEGSLNRAALAQRIFSDARARELLDQITHPPILRLLKAQIEACAVDLPPDTIVVVEVPLLFETKMQAWFERIVVVSASETIQTTRLALRNRLSIEEARRRIAAQMPLAWKIEQADVVIVNEGTSADLYHQVKALWRDLRAGAGDPGHGHQRRGTGGGLCR